MIKRTPHDEFITIHGCEDGYLLEYPDPMDSKKLGRRVISGDSEVKTISKLLNTLLEFLGVEIIDSEEIEDDKKDEDDMLNKIGFKIKTKD